MLEGGIFFYKQGNDTENLPVKCAHTSEPHSGKTKNEKEMKKVTHSRETWFLQSRYEILISLFNQLLVFSLKILKCVDLYHKSAKMHIISMTTAYI